jgi:hypothetical protein
VDHVEEGVDVAAAPGLVGGVDRLLDAHAKR